MKLLNAFLGMALIASPTGAQKKNNKTPYRRRLQKTFDLLDLWADGNLASHPHFTDKREDKNGQTKFGYKLDRITKNIYTMYEDRIKEIAQECPELATCQKYLDCTGEGDRMNTVRGRPAVELSDNYLDFVKDKWERSKARVFEVPECGFKMKQVANLSEKFVGMVDSFRSWRLQCRKYSGDSCPAHCKQAERGGNSVCTPKD